MAGTYTFQRRLFIYLFAAFLCFFAVTTLTHEGGHYAAMRMAGHRHPHIHYIYTDTGRNEMREERKTIRLRNAPAIKNHLPFPELQRFEQLTKQIDSLWQLPRLRRYNAEETFITAAGPAVPVIIGTVGVLLLLVFRRSFRQAVTLSCAQWVMVFTSLFWLIPAANLLVRLCLLLMPGYIDDNSDVLKFSIHFGISPWAINGMLGIIGAWAIWLAVKSIPAQQRFTTLMAGITGGISGWLLWEWIGPIILP